MAVQLSTSVRNAMLDAIESTVGTAPILKIRSGAQPANCAAADSGTVGATMTLPSDWLAAASLVQKRCQELGRRRARTLHYRGSFSSV